MARTTASLLLLSLLCSLPSFVDDGVEIGGFSSAPGSATAGAAAGGAVVLSICSIGYTGGSACECTVGDAVCLALLHSPVRSPCFHAVGGLHTGRSGGTRGVTEVVGSQ